jgi:osmotically-inducible protein OsmY
MYGQGRGSQSSWRPGGGSDREFGQGGEYGSGAGSPGYGGGRGFGGGGSSEGAGGYGEGQRRYGRSYGRGPEGDDTSDWRTERGESGSGYGAQGGQRGGSGWGESQSGSWGGASEWGGSGQGGYGNAAARYGSPGGSFGSQRGQGGGGGSQDGRFTEGADRAQQSWGGSYGFGYGGRGWQNRGRFAGKGPKGYQRSDDRIKEEISDRLEESGDIDASEITVMVDKGEATLEGTVPDRWMKRMAEDLVEDCSGVKQVHNRLRIKGREESGGRSGIGVQGLDTDTAGRAMSASAPGTGSSTGGVGGATGTGSAGSSQQPGGSSGRKS